MEKYHIIVIGAGSGGLVVAIGAVKAGKKVLLVERAHWGGDCTNFGCIPSKSLIASAHAAYEVHHQQQLGLEGGAPFTQTAKVFDRVRAIVEEVRSHEDPEALKAKGVETALGVAEFKGLHHLQIRDDQGGEREVFGENIVIATGSHPKIPSIEGLDQTPYLTNETVFDLKEAPKRFGVIGGGPIGCELAQAFSRLGSKVSLVHRRSYLLKKEEVEAQQIIAHQFEQEGISLILGPQPTSIRYTGEFIIAFEHEEIKVDQLLIAVGRAPNVEELHLEAAGVRFNEQGIIVDKFGRTNQKHIWVVGDVSGGPQFTHAAENQARMVLTSLLLPMKKRADPQPMPRVTFTDPEVASVGLLANEAEQKYGKEKVKIYHIPLTQNDRAVTASRTEGFVKVVTKRFSSKILGATIVGPRAGEMLPELSLAIKEKIPLRKLANLIHPYPTYNLAIRAAADRWLVEVFLPRLKNPFKGFPWKRAIPLGVILALMTLAYFTEVYKYFTFENLQSHHATMKQFVQGHPVITPILFMLIYATATALSFPGGVILSLIGGFLFVIPWSTIYVLIGASVGATAIFLAARTAIAPILKKKAGPFLKKMESGFQKNAWSYLLFLRFVPLFPFWLVNIAPAFFNVPLVTYIWTTFVGVIPGAYVYTQTGAGLGAILESGESFSLSNIFNVQIRIALVALALISLAPIFVKKIFSKKKFK